MKQIELSKLHTIDFAVTDLSALYQTPTWTTLDNRHSNTVPRASNGFLLVDNGACRYDWDGISLELTHGGLIYLPAVCRRSVTVIEREFSFYRLKFTLQELTSGDALVFSEKPQIITESAGQHLFDLCKDLVKSTISRRNHLKSTALLYEFFSAANAVGQRDSGSRILPALNYIEAHYTQDLNVETLAQMCYLSQAQLFRLFQAQMHTTPIQYRNLLRIERAREMLNDWELSIGEIAANLGFENLYYFSRLFHHFTGVSPTQYRQTLSNEIPPIK